jgi:peptidoglycan/LPS O-acetylase OafA/YrhL
MGLLRLYLALCIVSAHATPVLPWTMHDGMQAVQIFYIISGFYMAMVLSAERYASVRRFYASRFLRIFPLTWIVLLGVAAGSACCGLVTGHWLVLGPYMSRPFSTNGAEGVIIAAASNITLFGQDWVMFLSQPHGSPLVITTGFWLDPQPLFRYLLVPQAWSVGVELCFYVLVPFINQLRTGTIVSIAAVSLIARLAAYAALGLDHDPWTYRFFPFELFSFLLGMLAFRLYSASRGRLSAPAVASTFKGFALTSAVALTIFYGAARLIVKISRHVDLAHGSLLTYPLWAVLIAGLFVMTRGNRYDRTLGELSFPIYLVHYFIITVARGALERASVPQSWAGAVSAVLSIGVAVVLLKCCIEPIDRTRHVLARGGDRIVRPS